MNISEFIHDKHRFRLALAGHKAVETGAACLLFMVQGQLAQATSSHLVIASQTGALTVFPLLGITLTRQARHFNNRWMSATLLAGCAFLADAVIHGSHYPGTYTEAGLTAIGTFALSIVVSYTPLGRRIDRLAEAFHKERPGGEQSTVKAG
jgi:predicted membrane-bound mannosyltransferase